MSWSLELRKCDITLENFPFKFCPIRNLMYVRLCRWILREGTFFLGGGGLGPQRGGSSVKVSTKGGGPYPLFQNF